MCKILAALKSSQNMGYCSMKSLRELFTKKPIEETIYTIEETNYIGSPFSKGNEVYIKALAEFKNGKWVYYKKSKSIKITKNSYIIQDNLRKKITGYKIGEQNFIFLEVGNDLHKY